MNEFPTRPVVVTSCMSYDLNARQVRQVYLITYSRASPDVSRQGLADKVVTAFETCGPARGTSMGVFSRILRRWRAALSHVIET